MYACCPKTIWDEHLYEPELKWEVYIELEPTQLELQGLGYVRLGFRIGLG